MMTMPYYGTMTTAKAHGKTVHEQMRNTTGQGWLQDPNNHMTTECQKSCTNANRQQGH